MSAFVPFTGQQQPTVCDPYVCPGDYVPVTVPYEVMKGLHDALVPKISADDLRQLQILGWNGKRIIPPPTNWAPPQRRIDALNFMKLAAEIASRTYFSNAPGAYRPWTADPICVVCDRWIWGWAGDFSGWTWKGIHSIKAKLPYGQLQPNANIITCGMLRDVGIVKNAAECMEEDQAAVQAYRDMLIREAKKRAKGEMMGSIVGAVFMVVFAVVITVATWGAATPVVVAGALTSTLASTAYAFAQTGGKLSPSQIGQAVASMLASLATLGVSQALVTTLKAVVSVSLDAYELAQQLEEQEEQKKELKAQREALEAKTDEIRKLLEARAALDEVNAAVAELRAEVEKGRLEISQRVGSIAIIGGIGLALLALTFGRRR